MKNKLREQKGFTLIEIIAVLIILGILAAVAVPKYLDMTGDAKIKTAEGQVAEIKSTLNLAYAKYVIREGTKPSGQDVVDETELTPAGFTLGVTPDDWHGTLSVAVDEVTIKITARGTDTGYAAEGKWNVPPEGV